MSVDYRACCAGFAPRAAPPLERSARCSSFKCSGKRRKKPRGRRRGTSRGLADGDNLDHACADSSRAAVEKNEYQLVRYSSLLSSPGTSLNQRLGAFVCSRF